jgi:hypothetical protein
MIRQATANDVTQIVELGRRWLRESPINDITADNPKWATDTANMLVSAPYARTFVAERDGAIIGMIGFVVLPQIFSGELIAEELIWYVPREHRQGAPGLKLLWAAEAEAHKMGAKQMKMSAPTPDTAAVYRSNHRYRELYTTFVRVFQ